MKSISRLKGKVRLNGLDRLDRELILWLFGIEGKRAIALRNIFWKCQPTQIRLITPINSMVLTLTIIAMKSISRLKGKVRLNGLNRMFGYRG